MNYDMFIAGAIGFAPAILLMFYTLKNYTYPGGGTAVLRRPQGILHVRGRYHDRGRPRSVNYLFSTGDVGSLTAIRHPVRACWRNC